TPAPANDTCASPAVLNFVGDVATASGTTAAATNGNASSDPTPTCGAGGYAKSAGADVVYQYSLVAAQNITTPCTPPGCLLAPTLAARTQCAGPAMSAPVGRTSRSFSGTTTLNLANQPAGTYFLFVDSGPAELGAFPLRLERAPPTPAPTN